MVGRDVDYWKLTSSLMLTNNRRMQGKPDVDLYYGGQLTVGGNAPFTMGQFNYYVNESNPGRLLNTCDNMTADAASVRFAVEANKWYFFTPLYDINLSGEARKQEMDKMNVEHCEQNERGENLHPAIITVLVRFLYPFLASK